MPVLTPTKDTGAQAQAMAGVYVEPPQQMTHDQLARFMPDTGVNAPFVADLLSAALTHERCGRHLYRSVAGRSNNPMLVRKYRQFGEETERHAELLEGLIASAGGNPQYVSPMARAVQGMDTKMIEATFSLAGSVDLMTAETAMLDAVLLAETMDQLNWRQLRDLCEQLPAGPIRDQMQSAVDEVGAQEDEHLAWATRTKQRLVAPGPQRRGADDDREDRGARRPHRELVRRRRRGIAPAAARTGRASSGIGCADR